MSVKDPKVISFTTSTKVCAAVGCVCTISLLGCVCVPYHCWSVCVPYHCWSVCVPYHCWNVCVTVGVCVYHITVGMCVCTISLLECVCVPLFECVECDEQLSQLTHTHTHTHTHTFIISHRCLACWRHKLRCSERWTPATPRPDATPSPPLCAPLWHMAGRTH